jgi:hypothetical protein
MEKLLLICDCCGKTFSSKYYEDGYIDHTNLSRNFKTLVKNDIEYISYDITRHGNDYRNINGIKVRLKCFSMYCDKNNLNELKEKVAVAVENEISHLEDLDDIKEKIVDILEGLSREDKEYIVSKI